MKVMRVRIRLADGSRPGFEVPDAARGEALKALAAALESGNVDAPRVTRILKDAAPASPAEFARFEALAAELKTGAVKVRPTKPAAESFAQYAERWFDDRERRGLHIGSDRGRITNYVVPVIGALPIREVAADDLRRVVESLDNAVLAGRIHWNTARKIWGLTTKLFGDAYKSKVSALRVRDDNPARDVQGPDRGDRTAKQWLYPSEVSELLACPDVPPRWRVVYALAVYLYLRPGELAALEWNDVDLGRGIINVHQALDLATGRLKSTKTGITRKVPIHASLAPLLAALRPADGAGRVLVSEHANRKAAGGLPPVEDLAATLRAHLWKAGVRRADLHEERPTTKRMTFYDLRSTGITWEVLAGTEPLRVQQRAGHREFSTTQGYIRTAEELGGTNVGEAFPPLPPEIWTNVWTSDDLGSGSAAKKGSSDDASPRGFEPLLQP